MPELGLHYHGIVHRQISPTSLYLNAEGKVILGYLDFSTRLALEDEIGSKVGKQGYWTNVQMSKLTH